MTGQELRVAAAVSRGASNREIAAELFLAPKTVEFHLRQIYRKLGIGSRAQLVATLARQPVAGPPGPWPVTRRTYRCRAPNPVRPAVRYPPGTALSSLGSVMDGRDVAQFGSALDWGSRGRRFKSGRPDAAQRLVPIFEYRPWGFGGNDAVPTGICPLAANQVWTRPSGQGVRSQARNASGMHTASWGLPAGASSPSGRLLPDYLEGKGRTAQDWGWSNGTCGNLIILSRA
jgi:DNA-binding CsgD family transcriptional regulator